MKQRSGSAKGTKAMVSGGNSSITIIQPAATKGTDLGWGHRRFRAQGDEGGIEHVRVGHGDCLQQLPTPHELLAAMTIGQDAVVARIRTEPEGSTCRRNRRTNSIASSVR